MGNRDGPYRGLQACVIATPPVQRPVLVIPEYMTVMLTYTLWFPRYWWDRDWLAHQRHGGLLCQALV